MRQTSQSGQFFLSQENTNNFPDFRWNPADSGEIIEILLGTDVTAVIQSSSVIILSLGLEQDIIKILCGQKSLPDSMKPKLSVTCSKRRMRLWQ